MERVILHSDANCYYASVECLYTPRLRGKPMAVCGSVDDRHGIVLTKSEAAKKLGVKTGMAIWQAKQLCPTLECVQPDYELYMAFSEKLRRLYGTYTDKVEPFGLDECWLDVSQPGLSMANGAALADEIRCRVKRELGITVSIGVSYNKVYAKLGSDYKKPDAVTTIDRKNYRDIVWPLPASDLLYVGARTYEKLARIGVFSIGDLARSSADTLAYKFGKNGLMLKAFAMGLDSSPVASTQADVPIKSIGNSTTPPRDIESFEDAKAILYLLVESVCERLRAQGMKARQISVSIRRTDLTGRACQRTLCLPTDSTRQIAQAACVLFRERFTADLPLRSMGVQCAQLAPADAPMQLDLFGRAEEQMKAEALDRALDAIRFRYGHKIIRRGVVMADAEYARVDPSMQVIHPVSFLKEGCVSYDRA